MIYISNFHYIDATLKIWLQRQWLDGYFWDGTFVLWHAMHQGIAVPTHYRYRKLCCSESTGMLFFLVLSSKRINFNIFWQLKRCESWMKTSCEDQYDLINCAAAYNFCSDTYSTPFLSTGIVASWIPIFGLMWLKMLPGMNPYDMSKVCEGDREETMCYPQNK